MSAHIRSPEAATWVAVFADPPCYRRGLSAALEEAGYRVAEPVDIDTWAVEHVERVASAALVTVESRQTTALEPFRLGGASIVAIIRHPTADDYRQAILRGVAGAVDWAATPGVVLDVLAAALRGFTLLPLEIARMMSLSRISSEPSDAEVTWLRLLAQGTTISRLAQRYHYSEREMYRRLNHLYARIGVGGRIEAIAWLSGETSSPLTVPPDRHGPDGCSS